MFDRCPHAWLRDEARAETDAIDDVLFFERYGTLPDAGGTLDQYPMFAEALEIVREARAAIRQNSAPPKDGA